MDICEKALKFAVKAHEGQVRKSDPDKPMIIHPINVGHILKSYGFDDNVIVAGYLHDVIEDTKYCYEDIKKLFGDDVASLVLEASERDKSLSWEERKTETIDRVKSLDMRHKAVIAADKISNLEDLNIVKKINDDFDFSAFKRGRDSQKWYYEGVYNSLIIGEDKDSPMFRRLHELLEDVFYEKEDDYVKNVIFEGKEDEYKEVLKLHYKKQEVKKLRDVFEIKPYVIEFTGTPRTGKTTLINNLKDFFGKGNFSVDVLSEFTTTSDYKKNIYPKICHRARMDVNRYIAKHILKELSTALGRDSDIIIVDRSLYDRLVWVDRLYVSNGVSAQEYDEYKSKYLKEIEDKINIVIITYVDSITALKRDYLANLSLEIRNFLNEKNLVEYNNSLKNVINYTDNVNFYKFDTFNIEQRQVDILVCNRILDDMRRFYLQEINKRILEIVEY